MNGTITPLRMLNLTFKIQEIFLLTLAFVFLHESDSEPQMSLEDVVKRILLSRPDLSQEDVLKRIEEKRKGVEGYLTNETAARIVANELGVEVPQEFFKTEIMIEDVVSGLNDVTVTGRVISVHSPQTFIRSNMTKGIFAHLLIADKTGAIKVVFWNDKTSLVETKKLVEGQIVKVSHGYVGEGLDGKPELHVGSRGEIQVSPPNIKECDYPKIISFTKKIAETGKSAQIEASHTANVVKVSDIREEGGPINVKGLVATVPKTTQVTTARNEKVMVASFDLEDNTGKIRVSVWRKLTEVVKDIEVGTQIGINNAYVKKGFADQLELTSRTHTSIEVLSRKT